MTAPAETVSIFASLVTGNEAPSPWDGGWAAPVVVPLTPTPLDAQPSAYVQHAWRDRGHGVTREVRAAAAVNQDSLLLRLEWASADPHHGITDNDVFADACAVLFPADGVTADLQTMGSDGHPTVAWYWRAGTELPFVATARGLGTVTRNPKHRLVATSGWSDGRWAVVFRHPLGEKWLPAAGGVAVPVAFAAWNGANSERAGLAAYSPAWHSLGISQ